MILLTLAAVNDLLISLLPVIDLKIAKKTNTSLTNTQ